jgi:hypothetical protein
MPRRCPLATTLTIHDESTTGETLLELTLHVSAERITVRDLIRQRVFHEVDDYNRRKPDTFRGLVQPTDSERTLNGYRLKQPRTVDANTQLAKAIDAFAGNQIIMLVDDRQVESLDEEIVLGPGTRVSFLRLTPLVGG